MPIFDWFTIVSAAAVTVGVLEWIKGFFNNVAGKNFIPPWGWRLALAGVSAGVAASLDGGLYQVLTNALALIAMAQVSYPVLIQLPESAINAFRVKMGGKEG